MFERRDREVSAEARRIAIGGGYRGAGLFPGVRLRFTEPAPDSGRILPLPAKKLN
jgi:hypothetical protein